MDARFAFSRRRPRGGRAGLHRGCRRVWPGLVLAGVVAVAPGATVADAAVRGSAAPPASCQKPPVTMRLEALGAAPAGAAAFAVTDAVARRVPIVPRPGGGTTEDPKELARLRKEAARTSLALYSVYLADFRIPRRELSGFGFGLVTPKGDGTIATLSLVPTKRRGFSVGDVVRATALRYDTTTTFAALSLTVTDATSGTPGAFTDVEGRVKILALDDDTICVDIDVQFLLSGTLVSAARGVVSAPVVRAAPEFFYT